MVQRFFDIVRFSLWLSRRELTGRRVVFIINLIIIALLISLAVTMDFMGKARKSTIERKIDYIGPSMSLVPKGIRSSDLATARLRGKAFPEAVYNDILRDVISWLRASEVRLILRSSVEGKDVPLVGVDFGSVYSYPFSQYSPGNHEVLMGDIAAAKLGKSMGDAVKIRSRTFTVAGIIPTMGGIDDVSLFVSLPVLQEMMGQEDGINEIRLFPLSASAIDGLREDLSGYLSLVDIVDSNRGEIAEGGIDTTLRGYQGIIYTVAFVLVAFCIFISTYINVDARKTEIATVHTLGASKGIIFRLLTFRTVWIALLGATIGHILALVTTLSQDAGVLFADIWSWGSFIAIIGATVLLGLTVTTPVTFFSVYRRNLVEHL